ncbi:MAG TPA: hypothetical protein VGY57_16585 [Vicinamibacterales bacterium]|nr:hypothetical protein [Vicinamibacterales bacterium]
MPVALLLATLASALTFTPPAGWHSSNPTSSMRVAEFTLPRAAGDPDDAQLVVYYFGGSGGSVDANIERWVGQMKQPDGKASSAAATRETRKVHGLTVTLVDVSGTYVAEMAPGSSEHHNQSHYRLRAGVVETSNGPYFIKLAGPEKTIAKWDAAFNQFVGSMEFK